MGVNHGGTGETRPPDNLHWGGAAMMFVPQNSAHIMYLTMRYAIYLYLIAHGVMYYTAFKAGSVW